MAQSGSSSPRTSCSADSCSQRWAGQPASRGEEFNVLLGLTRRPVLGGLHHRFQRVEPVRDGRVGAVEQRAVVKLDHPHGRAHHTGQFVHGEADRERVRRWMLVGSIAGIVIGVLVFTNTGVSALALLYVIGAYAIVLGVAAIGSAFVLPLSGVTARCSG